MTKIIPLILLLLSGCALVYAPDCEVTVHDNDTVTVHDVEALTK